jgi:signal transduction histidine kinase
VMAVRLRGGLVDGRVFVLDRRSPTTEDMALAAIVARQIEHQLALGYLTRIQQDAAVATERGRVARDVHDGVLQSLTSVALRLETIRRQLESKPPDAAAGIQELQNMVLVEQQSLREFVRYLQGDQAHADSGLSELLAELVLRLEGEWRVRMKLTILLESNRLNTLIPAGLAREIYQLVREALVNVGRHARASQAWVTLDASDEEVFLMVADDGVGFGFQGTQERTQLVRRGHGPKMLLARVAVLGGSLSIGSSPAGARVVIKVPLGR